jgi:Caenorhabditis protein of unknown function, DUF268
MEKPGMLKQIKALARNWIMAFMSPRPFVGIVYLPRFFLHGLRYARSAAAQRLRFIDLQPCLGDWTTVTPFDAHYFYQGAWLARRIRTAAIARHVDVGSSVLTMSVLSAHVDTTFVDYRPLTASLPGLTSIAGNILDLPFSDNSLPSVSCLHVIEHIGLGRYGDPLDPLGSEKAALELQRVVTTGGLLFLSLPIGRERVCFNAHRVHAPATVLRMFPQMRLIEFSCVDDTGRYLEHQETGAAAHFEYGCGLFLLQKCAPGT